MENFKQWMQSVDSELTGISGLSSSDLADICYRDMFDDGMTANDAAIECLEYNDYPMELL